jgi:glycosyltransferase involved in cell wall biosynthesis
VDVVIPVKYGESFLPESVASALDQTGATMRVCVVDDGADAAIGPLLAGFPAESVRVVANGGAPGIGGARNFGAGLGDAPFLAFLDADDVWPPQRTEELLRTLGGPVACDLAFGLVEQFVEGDPGAFRVSEAPSPGLLAGGMLMRRGVWTQIGPFDERLVLGEFIDWLARARSMGLRESSIDSVALRRRFHGDNTTIHRRADRAAYADVIRRHLRRQDGR